MMRNYITVTTLMVFFSQAHANYHAFMGQTMTRPIWRPGVFPPAKPVAQANVMPVVHAEATAENLFKNGNRWSVEETLRGKLPIKVDKMKKVTRIMNVANPDALVADLRAAIEKEPLGNLEQWPTKVRKFASDNVGITGPIGRDKNWTIQFLKNSGGVIPRQNGWSDQQRRPKDRGWYASYGKFHGRGREEMRAEHDEKAAKEKAEREEWIKEHGDFQFKFDQKFFRNKKTGQIFLLNKTYAGESNWGEEKGEEAGDGKFIPISRESDLWRGPDPLIIDATKPEAQAEETTAEEEAAPKEEAAAEEAPAEEAPSESLELFSQNFAGLKLFKLFAALIGVFVAGGVVSAVLGFRQGLSTTYREPLLVVHS